MAVIKTLKGQTVITVVCNVVYNDCPPDPTPAEEGEKLLQNMYKMASAWRVMTFFIIVFAIPVILIALPLYARYTLYPTRSLPLMAADTIDLRRTMSSFWCQGERMSSNGTFDAYLMPASPKVNKRRRKSTIASSILKVTEEEPEYKILHLLKGSSFKFGVCSRWPGATVIVVQGKKNFKNCYYKEDRDWDDVQEKMKEELKKTSRSNELNPKFYAGSTNPLKKAPVVYDELLPKRTNFKPTILAPTNEDVFDKEESGGGGEITELPDDELLDIDEIVNLQSTAIPQQTSTTPHMTQKYQPGSDGITAIDVDSTTKLPVKLKLKKTTSGIPAKDKHNEIKAFKDLGNDNVGIGGKKLRTLRSVSVYRDDADGSDEHRLREEEAMRKLGLLHSVNDTRDVTAGNSSFSSSEEFMQGCTNTLLSIDVKHLVDCQSQDVSKLHNWFFRINETDDYYVILMSDNSLEENILKYYMEIDRVMYNVSENRETCSNSSECVFPIRFLSSEAVVVEMAEQNNLTRSDSLVDLEVYEMQAVCQPRVAVYMVFILMVPFIILMFAFQ